MVYRYIYSSVIRGPIGVLCPPCPSAEAGNQGNSLENDVFGCSLTLYTIGNDHQRNGLPPGARKFCHGCVGHHLGMLVLPFEAFWLMHTSTRFFNGSSLQPSFLVFSSCYSYIQTWRSLSPTHQILGNGLWMLDSFTPPSVSFWSFP